MGAKIEITHVRVAENGDSFYRHRMRIPYDGKGADRGTLWFFYVAVAVSLMLIFYAIHIGHDAPTEPTEPKPLFENSFQQMDTDYETY